MKRTTLGLLALLRLHGEEGCSAARIARELGISPEKVSEEILHLAAAGFPVKEQRTRRWSLGPGGPLVAEEVRAGLGTTLIGRRVITLDETVSTQDVARREAAGSSRAGTVVFAEKQSRGRGRFHREWQSEHRKDLTFSVVLRAPHRDSNPSLLTVTASVAVCETLVEALNLPARIRWPNDILLAGRKVAGILVERTAPAHQPPAFLLGVGVNVNSRPVLESATSTARNWHGRFSGPSTHGSRRCDRDTRSWWPTTGGGSPRRWARASPSGAEGTVSRGASST